MPVPLVGGKIVAGTVPKSTPMMSAKLLPLIVSNVPPVAGPLDTLNPDTIGAAW